MSKFDLVPISSTDIEFFGSSNHTTKISIEGVATATIKGQKEQGYIALYKVVDKEGKLSINKELYEALKLVFDVIKNTERDTLTRDADRSLSSSIEAPWD